MKESWHSIPGYKNLYEINIETEEIKSLSRRVNHMNIGFRETGERTFKPRVSNGYKTTSLYKKGVMKNIFIHRVIAKLFIPNPKNQPCINHKNGIKTDNRIENLEWCTKKENTAHAHKVGLIKAKGENNGRAKITLEIAKKIRSEYIPNKVTRVMLANRYGICKGMVDHILQNNNWV